ncbi:hypothetical protein Ppa06_57530 [Planomonospora parontospora subsp. parontospora]|uniref:Uncharacterized protein n=2 Tax=Planomonospora parontospora TaxID=58119 RepID=A0AA37BLU0_9ACTN|nr:hypothetical protein [Planomonospora parontospora]GGK90798.1 hypothetical protein GCM10010126_57780 [Planomonospora parontospora]GII11955.1 hypothetical protein Ppa06_57530 [Planomonospora parontospora subsp. parontospora]
MNATPTFQAVLCGSGFSVRRTGCRDIARDIARSVSAVDAIPVIATAAEAIAAELNQDFIAEGSMTADEALDYVTFVGCTGLA